MPKLHKIRVFVRSVDKCATREGLSALYFVENEKIAQNQSICSAPQANLNAFLINILFERVLWLA
jgi:hypothetical protein